jgi:hypothetical protein
MRRARPVFMSVLMTFCAVVIQAVEFPHSVAACYCETQPFAESAADDDATVVSGSVAQELGDRTRIVVDAWFHGPFPTDVIWVRQGSGSRSSCDLNIAWGQRRVFVLFGGPRAPGANGLYSTSLCDPGGVVGTPEGDAVLAQAVQIFGEPLPLAAAPATTTRPAADDGLAYAAIATVLAVLMFGAIALVARRRAQP